MRNDLMVLSVFFSLVFIPSSYAQDVKDLDKRLRVVEDYLESLPPSLATYTGSLEESITKYTKNLELGLEKYSARLEKSLESRLVGLSNRIIELDANSPAYQKIETSTGTFFIAIQDIEEISGGYRMSLQIGNPNYADFRDFSVRLVWGQTWSPSSPLTYEQWRDTLEGAQYSFNGRLERGRWNTVEVDLIPAAKGDLAYLECELTVAAIELDVR